MFRNLPERFGCDPEVKTTEELHAREARSIINMEACLLTMPEGVEKSEKGDDVASTFQPGGISCPSAWNPSARRAKLMGGACGTDFASADRNLLKNVLHQTSVLALKDIEAPEYSLTCESFCSSDVSEPFFWGMFQPRAQLVAAF